MSIRVGFQVTASNFVAGFDVDVKTNRVVEAPPILRRWLMGKTSSEARRIIAQRGWKYAAVGHGYNPWDLDRCVGGATTP
jgi:hypothetical protein